MAKTRLAKVVLTIKGEWSPEVEYEKLDLVNYLGSSYIAKRDNIGVTPVEGDDWSLSAEKGGKGDQGDKIYLHIAYANSQDGETDFTTSPVIDKAYAYLGSYSDYTPEDSTTPSDYRWFKLSEEAERVAAELLRVAAEDNRVAAETAREIAEESRVSDEAARKISETSRVNAETVRVSAENARVLAEQGRVTETQAAISRANTAASNAQSIADTVQSKLDAGDFVGPKGDKGDKGEKGNKGDPGQDAPQDVVRYSAQDLTADQQEQARVNIGAADVVAVNGLKDDIAKFGYIEMYGNNLLDYDACEENKRIDSSNGDAGEVSGAITTDYMRVENGKSYVFALLNSANTGYSFIWNRYAVYDVNRSFIYGDTFAGSGSYSAIEIANENAAFIRCSTSSNTIDSFKAKKAIFGDASYWVSSGFMMENYEEYAKEEGIPKEKIIGLTDALEEIGDIKTGVLAQEESINEIEKKIKNQGDSINKVNSTIEAQKEYFVDDFNTVNRCDNSKMMPGLAIYHDNGETYENAAYVSTDYIDIGGLTKIALYSCITDAHTPHQEFWRGAWYKDDKTYLSGLNNQPTANNPQRGVLTVPVGARYVRVCFIKNINFGEYMCASDGTVVDYVPYSYGHKEIITYPDWIGRTWFSYGDSITAIGNPTYVDGEIGEIAKGSWQRKVRDYLHMGRCYGRGIGGQTFTYNTRPWFANQDGSYNSRDDNGDMTDPSSYTVPEGCTAHYGYFASWDRITTMIPDEIKDSIDLITVFGVNDAVAALNFDPTTWTAPQWKLDSELTGVRDEAWLAADESIINASNHGDFDISDLSGAIASTILKLQARCPNAVIVFGTSWSGKGGGELAINTGNYDTDGIAYYKHAQLVKTVAHYYSIPVVDIWGTSGVNPFNRNANNQDSTHPYKSHGKMMLARAWIGGLKGIVAMID